MTCTTCDGAAGGYKCDMCGAESATHDDAHSCGGERCVAKCTCTPMK